MTYEQLYQAFVAYCQRQPDQLDLCGLSLGGILALNYTLDFPVKVSSLVLIGAQAKMPTGLLKLQSVVFRCLPKQVFTEIGLENAETIQLMNSMSSLDFSAELGQINCPTLVVCGSKDKVNRPVANLLATAIPHSILAVIEGAGHEVNLDAPAQLTTMLELFYQKLS